jgi:hypothetical protein
MFYEYETGVRSDTCNEWVYNTIIAKNHSIELLLGWSAVRITIAVSFPVILSFAVGLWYMKKTGDVQTAWTLASYIVTGVGGE